MGDYEFKTPYQLQVENESLKHKIEHLEDKLDSAHATCESLAWSFAAVVIIFFVTFGFAVYELYQI